MNNPQIPIELQVEQNINERRIQAEQGMNAPALQQQSQQIQAALVEQTNPSHILDDVELKLRGYRQKWDGSFEKFGQPLMNDKGIGRMLFLLSTVVNQNTILSHLKDQEIGKLICRVDEDVVDDLVLNWKEYGITDKILLDSIVDAIVIPAFVSLKRAWEQNEKNWLNKIVLENVNNAPRLQPRREGFMSKLKL